MFKLNRAAAIETVKIILFSIVVAIVTALVVNFLSFQTIMFGFLILSVGFLIKTIYDYFVEKQKWPTLSDKE